MPFILAALAKREITSKNQLVAALATIYTEVPVFKPIREYGRGGGAHGEHYGRGFAQITHWENYNKYSKDAGIDIVNNPDLALDAATAADIFSWFWVGSTGTADIRPYAERGDWRNVRAILNAGHAGAAVVNGLDVFLPAIKRGLQFLEAGLDPETLGTLPGSYGLGCADTGDAPMRTYSDLHNPGSMGDAIASALGLANNAAWHSHEFYAVLNVAANPELLRLRAQTKFNLQGMGEDLDGEYLVDEANFNKGQTLELVVLAHQKDPATPQPIVFRNDSEAPLVKPNPTPTVVDYSSIIHTATQDNLGKSSKSGPGGGKMAAAWTVGRFAIVPAGLTKLGEGTYGSESVAGILQALQEGRGVAVERSQASPGDLWFDGTGNLHIGVVQTVDESGASQILSNSATQASFSWIASVEELEQLVGGSSQFWRVTS